jgi:hypothetical protein
MIRARIKPLDERMPGMCLIDVRRVVGHGNTQARLSHGREVPRNPQAPEAQRQAVLLASGTQASETRGAPRSND